MKNKLLSILLLLTMFLTLAPVAASEPGPAPVASEIGDSSYICFNDGWQFHLVSRDTNALLGVSSGSAASRREFQQTGFRDIDPEFRTADVIKPVYDDSGWRTVDLPHDWSIEGYKVPGPQGLPANGFMEGGLGWYRKTFTLPAGYSGANRVSIEFDGIFQNSVVYLNGEEIIHYPSGYTGFQVDLSATGLLKYGAEENVIAVKVQAAAPGSRWYTGAGIYQPVRLVVTGMTNFIRHSVIYDNPDLESLYKANGSAMLRVRATAHTLESNCVVSIRTTVMNGNAVVATSTSDSKALNAGNAVEITDTVTVPNVRLWGFEDPFRYNIITELLTEVDGTASPSVTDKKETKFGFRYFEIDRDEGFFLNGKYSKLNGVCMHHDQGSLGAAVHPDAIRREIEILKSMGANSIRTSHNPYSKAFLDLCSELGVVVLSESFDGWGQPKASYDFGIFFLEEIPAAFRGQSIAWETMADRRYPTHKNLWSDWVIQEMVLRDINEPSIIMWSIGNEVPSSISSGTNYAGLNTVPAWYNGEDYRVPGDVALNSFIPAQGANTSAFNDFTEGMRLRNNIRAVDPNRYIVKSSDRVRGGEGYMADVVRRAPEQIALSNSLDGYGVNYGLGAVLDHLYANFSPNTFWFDAETSSQTGMRGVYFETELPAVAPSRVPGNRGLSSMDNHFTNWTAPSEFVLKQTRDRKFSIGTYVWTGFDYIGEPTPFGTTFPVGVSSFGIVDTAGFPKDNFFLYQSQWLDRVKSPMAHIAPMNWTDWADGQNVRVRVYTNAIEAELFLNGESLGIKRFNKKTTVYGMEYYETSEPTWDGGGNGFPGTANTGPINPGGYVSPNNEFGNLYLHWNVPFAKGTLEVIARDEDGKVVATDVRKTAEKARTITMKPNKEYLQPDGRSLLYVECDIVDASGTTLPSADNLVRFSVEGNGTIVGVDNGKPDSDELYKWGNVESGKYSERSAFSGKVLVIIQSEKGSGDIKLTASSSGLLPAVLTIGTAPGTQQSVAHPELGAVVEVERKHAGVATGSGTILPRAVKVTYSSGITLLHQVTWEDIASSQFENPGVFSVKGTFDDISVDAEAFFDIIVSDDYDRVNLGRNTTAAPTATVSATLPLATASFSAAEGNAPNYMLNEANNNHWMNTNTTGRTVVLAAYNASRRYDNVVTYWPNEVTFDEVNLFFTTTGNSRLPESLNVQYWDGFYWVDAPNQQVQRQTASNTATIITFDQVTASKVRAVMKNATPHVTAGVMQVTQFRTYGNVADYQEMRTISYGPFANGRVAGPALASAGMVIDLVVTPHPGFRFVAGSLKANGEPITGNSFTMPDANVVITAEFEQIGEGATNIGIRVEGTEIWRGGNAVYTVFAERLNNVNLITLTYNIDGSMLDAEKALIEGLSGFRLFGAIEWSGSGNNRQATARLWMPNDTRSGDFDVSKLELQAIGYGSAAVSLSDISVVELFTKEDGSTDARFSEHISNPQSAMLSVINRYDINRDGVVDELDLAIAMSFYLATPEHPQWAAQAWRADVNRSGKVDMADLIDIFANFTARLRG